MKKLNFAATLVALAGIVTVCVSCEKTNNSDSLGENELRGRVTKDLTLRSGQVYNLTGSLQVIAPATLTVEPGVRVVAADNGEINYILIEQGAKINAVGTAEQPIVFTSEREETGAWGGLHICGKAHSNKAADPGKSLVSEIGNAVYGGSQENDNSGVLKYVRIENSGYKLDAEHEANGLSLYGVGSGTSISYIQCYNGSDDGIEFFGSSVSIDHCIVTNCTDDSFDWTEGWNGSAEYLVAIQSDPSCDCLFECDNNGDDFNAKPTAHPTIKHVTLIGNNSSDNSKGVRLRAGTEISLENALIYGKDNGIYAETEQTLRALAEGRSILKNVYLSKNFKEKVSGESIYSSSSFIADGNKENVEMTFTKGYIGMIDGNGAVEASDDWTAKWTR